MRMIPEGMYIANVSTKSLINVGTQVDYGKYVLDWSKFETCGFDYLFDSGYISILEPKSEPESVIIYRNPTISYENVMKFRIAEIFDTSLFDEEG